MRSVTVLGATGSVGSSTIDILQRNTERFSVVALVANRNVAKLVEQSLQLRPRLAVVADDTAYESLKSALAGTGIEVAAGANAVIEAASCPSDLVMSAIVGATGLQPTLAAIRRGAIIGLANKETLVSAGSLVMSEISLSGAKLIPVDSEHSAIFQVFDFEQRDRIEKIILTASGGPFRSSSIETMTAASPEQAIAHPNWDMGAKISVDSATMMNKGLELIEAYHLFAMPEDRIDILVHPQSVIHSMVSYVDGSVLAQLGSPDMRTPIAFALGWPERLVSPSKRLDFCEISKLTFEPPDSVRFPSLRLAREALRRGKGAATVMNAANEVAVHAFLGRSIGFCQISELVEKTMAKMPDVDISSLDTVLAVDGEARRLAVEISRAL